MKWLFALVATLGILLGDRHSPAADPAPAGHDLSALERFIGEWTVDGTWSNGTPLHARSVYEWGLGKKIMTAKTFVKDGDKEYQRYEGILAWHPERKSLFEISFGIDGSISEILIDRKNDDTLHFGWTAYQADKPSRVRQVIQFTDKDHFRWTVTIKDGDGWKQLIDATWKRREK